MSTAFADQFRLQLARPDMFAPVSGNQPTVLALVDDNTLGRQLAEDKTTAQLTDALRPEMLLLFSRLQTLWADVKGKPGGVDMYAPLSVVRALTRALDSLDFDPKAGTLLLQNSTTSLRETLKTTYSALGKYLNTQGVEERTVVRAVPGSSPRKTTPDGGEEILAHIQSLAAQPAHTNTISAGGNFAPEGGGFTPAGGTAPTGGTTFSAPLPSFLDSLAYWQSHLPQEPGSADSALVLRQLQQGARQTDAGQFDLAVLDAVAGLYEFILDDPDISSHYKSAITQLQIPTLRAALGSPDFFSDDLHPARQLIDLLGLYSRRFPEHNPAHAQALQQVEAACEHVIRDPDHPTEGFAQAQGLLTAWLDDENARTEAELADEVTNLEQIERHELGTLLALENLQDLTARHPAPESVLRRLEAAWVPYMASLYVAEAGEGPNWRAACMTLLQLFLSLLPPEDDETREARLQSIPRINAELRFGLLAQGAEPAQLKDFFGAITATQECWVRPAVGQQEALVSTFKPRHLSQEDIQTLAQRLEAPPEHDTFLQQAEQLLEGDWVDFDPPFEGLATARVAWVGVHGFLLFCDSEGEQRFSLDCERLAAEIRAGHASIPELSLTRKAMLRLKTQLLPAYG